MSVKAAPRLYWILSGLLCLCTLVALWITAWKIRQEKVEARLGGREAEPSDTDRPRRVPVPRGKAARAGHFKIGYPRDGTLTVFDLNSRLLVTFPDIPPGGVRAWQELRLKWIAADASSCVVEVSFVPGSPCRGLGDYAGLKPGLRIELDPDVHLTVERWDPGKPEIFLVSPSGSAGLAEGGEFRFPPYRARLEGRVLRLERH